MERGLLVEMLHQRPSCIPRPNPGSTKAQINGFLHEYKMHKVFEEWYGDWYLPAVWFRYQKGRGPHWAPWQYCQTDGLLFRKDGRVIICEAKLCHTRKAYGQLEMLYRPVIEALLPSWKVLTLEVVRWYREDNEYPVPIKLIKDPIDAEEGKFNLYILSSRGIKDAKALQHARGNG